MEAMIAPSMRPAQICALTTEFAETASVLVLLPMRVMIAPNQSTPVARHHLEALAPMELLKAAAQTFAQGMGFVSRANVCVLTTTLETTARAPSLVQLPVG